MMQSIDLKSPATATLAIREIIKAQAVKEGEGVLVHRSFPTGQLDFLDPFLLLDEMGPTNYAPYAARGFSDHPHKGFETVTYMLAGGMRHRDSAGNQGFLRPGDVQWMTAGSGLVHSEMPDPEFASQGGLMHGFQLWVNLPRKDKLVAPRYQDMASRDIPVATTADGRVKVKIIAGEALGVVAPIETHTPITYLHFTLEAGADFSQAVPASYNTMAYIVAGTADFGGGKTATSGELVIFDRGENAAKNGAENMATISFAAGDRGENKEALSLLLIGGEPLNEPVARYGPFVMNTREELVEAAQQYHNGLLGKISRKS